MFVYQDKKLKVSEPESESAQRTDLQRKWLMFQRMFNTRPARINYAVLAAPMMQLLLNHFYDTEVKGPYKFNQIELTDSVMRNFFDDVVVNHLP